MNDRCMLSFPYRKHTTNRSSREQCRVQRAAGWCDAVEGKPELAWECYGGRNGVRPLGGDQFSTLWRLATVTRHSAHHAMQQASLRMIGSIRSIRSGGGEACRHGCGFEGVRAGRWRANKSGTAAAAEPVVSYGQDIGDGGLFCACAGKEIA